MYALYATLCAYPGAALCPCAVLRLMTLSDAPGVRHGTTREFAQVEVMRCRNTECTLGSGGSALPTQCDAALSAKGRERARAGEGGGAGGAAASAAEDESLMASDTSCLMKCGLHASTWGRLASSSTL